jgi:hypothetical protein
MRTFAVPLAALVCLGASAAAFAADRNVPKQYPTIQAAADAAQPGDRVVVGPGTYAESVTMSKSSVAFVGKKAVWQGLTAANGHRDCLTVTGDGISVTGFTFRNGNRHLTITGNHATVSGCTSRGARTQFLLLSGDDALVTKCRVVGTTMDAIETTGARHVISRTTVDACRDTAIRHNFTGEKFLVSRCTVRACVGGPAIYAGGQFARVERTSVLHCANTAIYIYGPQSSADHNVVVGTPATAIQATGDGFKITGNSVTGCESAFAAITGRDDGTAGIAEIVSDNVVTDCVGSAFSFVTKDATYQRNRVERCGSAGTEGFLIRGTSSGNLVDANTVIDCYVAGFSVDGTDEHLTGNVATGCGTDGFVVFGLGARLERCVATGNGTHGLHNSGGGTTATGCTLLDNYVDVVNDGMASFANAATFQKDNRYGTGGPSTLPDTQ